MAHDDQFTATGPPLAGSGFPRSGFSTLATGMVYGVNVQGDKAGLYAESVRAATDRESHLTSGGIGVYGVGDIFGVFGRIHRRPGNPGVAGVVGHHHGAGVGMIGAALTLPDGRGGIGIAGISHTSLNPPVFASLPDPAQGSGTGVFGTSGSGTGVRGTSAGGSGVVGESRTSAGVRANGRPGGEFRSPVQHAQVRLVPHRVGGSPPAATPVAPRERKLPRNQLPKDGKIGDLLLTEHDAAVRCILWVCVADTPGHARWAQLLLGTPIEGTHPGIDD
jgi:hypothetical protein